VIFNNAGMNRPRDFMDVDEANFQEIVRVNAWGVILCAQEAAKQMVSQASGGKIIDTGSIAGHQGFWDFVPYCVAKFGVLAVTQPAESDPMKEFTTGTLIGRPAAPTEISPFLVYSRRASPTT
jgi:meso-butanediol dehydrogenase/(S,S)-butanediol dehydrogenase/diacetyl reductase